MTTFVISGVAGAGKSTITTAAAARLQLPFVDADNFHPPANVAKMSAGIPLTDEDRIDWIDALVRAVNAAAYANLLIACSALTRKVREQLRNGVAQPIRFIHLTAPSQVLQKRLLQRRGHFMKADMLHSQLQALEVPLDARVVDTDRPLEEVVIDVVDFVREQMEYSFSKSKS
jgi:gluconokinase